MQSSMTRQEQKILLIILVIITIGLAWQEYRRGRPQPLWVESKPGAAQTPAQSGGSSSPPDAGAQRAEAGQLDSMAPGEKLDLNRATAEELESLPGIGPQRARDIIAHRESHGPFASVASLDDVSGIGPSILARLEPFITVTQIPTSPVSPAQAANPAASPAQNVASTPPQEIAVQAVIPGNVPFPAPGKAEASATSKININIAGQEELEQLDQIGEKTAQAILTYRKQHGPFQKPEDLMNVPGIGPKKYEMNKDRITVR